MQTAEGGYIAVGARKLSGLGNQDAWVVKLTSQGRVSWTRTFGRLGSDRFEFVQQTSDGGYLVGGALDAFGTSPQSKAIIAKLDARGKIQWNRIYSANLFR